MTCTLRGCGFDHFHNTTPRKAQPLKIYIAGPMRGKPEFNFPAFEDAFWNLRNKGHDPFSPAARDLGVGFNPAGMTGHEDLASHGFDLRKALAADTQYIAEEADAVAVLPGWENSSGARAEVALAHALGLIVAPVHAVGERGEVIDESTLIMPATPPSGSVLNEGAFRPMSTADVIAAEASRNGEVRTTSSTGGEKGTKDERYDLLPAGALATVARHYGIGARKYAAHNWRRGYEWSKSYAALQRHLNAFWGGEDIDDETQSPHMAADRKSVV